MPNPKTERIAPHGRCVFRVSVEVSLTAGEIDRVLGEEPLEIGAVVPSAIIIIGAVVVLAAGELEGDSDERSARRTGTEACQDGLPAERFVGGVEKTAPVLSVSARVDPRTSVKMLALPVEFVKLKYSSIPSPVNRLVTEEPVVSATGLRPSYRY